MAKGKITKDQVIEDGIFTDFISGATRTLDVIDNLDNKLKKSLATQREFLAGWKAFDSKSIRDLNAAMADSAKIQKQLEQLEQERAKTQAALVKVSQENEKLVRLTLQTQKEKNKIDEQAAKATKKKADEEKKLNSVYEQNKKSLNEVVKQLKELESRGRGGGMVAKALREEFVRLDTQVRKAEYSVGQFQRNVGNYPQIMGNAEKAVRGLGGSLLNIAGIAGGTALFRSAIMNVAQFEQSLADLSAITGATGETLDYLKDQALKMGTTTLHSAVDILEAYKLIASAKPELLEDAEALNKVTEAAITMADASGLELPQAATALTDALNQFGASASEAQRYINALAAGAKFGSAEIPEVTEALLKFGVAAKSSNISIEESVGLIETFAEKGLKGAEAGTALRNILLKLSAARALPPEALHQLEAAGVDIKKLSDNSLSLSQRLEELGKIQGNSVALVKTFGLENEVAAQALIENRKRVDELTKSVTDTNVAQEQAAERTNTVEGELKRLANTWQALIIKFGQGGGDLKNIIKFIRENLETIVNVVINVTQAFIAYKASVMAVNAAYKVRDIVSYITNLVKVKAGLQAAEVAQQGMNKAMMANVIGLVVAGIVTLIDQFDLFTSAADRVAEAQDEINQAMDDSKTKADALVKSVDDQVEALERYYNIQKKIRESKGQGIFDLDFAEFSKKESILIQAINKASQKTAEAGKEALKRGQELRDTYDLLKSAGVDQSGNAGLITSQKYAIEAKNNYDIALAAQQELETQLTELRQQRIAKENNDAKEAADEKEALTKKEIEAAKKARDEEYALLIRQIEREKNLEETAILRTKDSEERKADLKRAAELSFLEKKLVIDKAFEKEFEKTELELVAKKVEIENAELARKKALAEKLAEIQKEYDKSQADTAENKFEKQRQIDTLEFNEKIKALEKQKKEIDENTTATPEEKKKALDELNQIEINAKKELDDKLNKTDEDQNNENFDKDLSEWNDYYKQRELLLLNSGKSQAEIEAQQKKDRIEQLQDEIELRKQYGKETVDQEIELARMQQEVQVQAQQKRLQTIKDFSSQALTVTEREVQNQNQRREQAIDTEIQQDQDKVSRQRELAAKGVANTLAFEDAQLAKAELKKAQQARKEIRDQEKITFLKLLQGYATEGKSSEAVRRALTDIALTRVIEGSFFHGAENIADALGQPMRPGRDGYVVAVDGSERVMTGDQNQRVGDLSNEELADVARAYNTGELVPRFMAPAMVIPGKSYSENYASAQMTAEIRSLKDEMRGVKQAIENRPVVQHGFNQLGEYIRTEIYKAHKETTVFKKPRI